MYTRFAHQLVRGSNPLMPAPRDAEEEAVDGDRPVRLPA
jgi:hypothetical protein